MPKRNLFLYIIERNLEIIGEVESGKQATGKIEVIAMRNKVIHEYFDLFVRSRQNSFI